jgi:hypothetical protein
MKKDSLFDHPSEALGWFKEPMGILFLEQIREWLTSSTNQLEKEAKLEEIYRLQGEISSFRGVISIPEDIRRLEEDKKSGKRS